MAWIKLEHATPDKPEVALLARKLGVSHEVAFVNLVRVLIWADNNVVNGDVPHLSLDDGDTLARVTPGTFAALASAEISWVIQREQGDRGFSFREWDRHNGTSAKHRAVDAAKKQRKRTVSRFCPDATGTQMGTREEKIREEKTKEKEPHNPLAGGMGSPDVDPKGSASKATKRPARTSTAKREPFDPMLAPIPVELRTPEFLDAWTDWIAVRREQRKPLTKRAVDEQLRQLAEAGPDAAVKAIRKSIANDWQGVFPESAGRTAKPSMTFAGTKAFLERGAP